MDNILSVLNNYTLDNADDIAKALAEDFRKRRIEKNLTREQEMVLDKYYRMFVRGGALLDDAQKKKLVELNKELSLATIQFGENSLAETNAFTLLITDKKDLAGLPDDVMSAAQERAEAAGKKGWLFTLQKPSWEDVHTRAAHTYMQTRSHRPVGINEEVRGR